MLDSSETKPLLQESPSKNSQSKSKVCLWIVAIVIGVILYATWYHTSPSQSIVALPTGYAIQPGVTTHATDSKVEFATAETEDAKPYVITIGYTASVLDEVSQMSMDRESKAFQKFHDQLIVAAGYDLEQIKNDDNTVIKFELHDNDDFVYKDESIFTRYKGQIVPGDETERRRVVRRMAESDPNTIVIPIDHDDVLYLNAVMNDDG